MVYSANDEKIDGKAQKRWIMLNSCITPSICHSTQFTWMIFQTDHIKNKEDIAKSFDANISSPG